MRLAKAGAVRCAPCPNAASPAPRATGAALSGLWGHPLSPTAPQLFLMCLLRADGEGWSSAALWEDVIKTPLVCPAT